MSTTYSRVYSMYLHKMKLRLLPAGSHIVRRMICYRKIFRLCCNRLLISFLVGMVCLEILATFASFDTQFTKWPLQFSLRILSEQEPSEILSTTEQTRILRSDDVLDIQSGENTPEDPVVLEYIRRKMLYPSKLPLNLSDETIIDRSEAGQALMADKLLGSKRNGYFVEIGAGNGEDLSTTLFFERRRNWTGLLVEPHPQEFEALLYKRRKAYTFNMCVSPSNFTARHILRAAKKFGSGLKGPLDRLHQGYQFSKNPDFQGDLLVQCVPFTSIINALNVHEIDYLSLDVEGAETEILENIPFEMMRINTISVDYAAQGQLWDQGSRSLQKLERIREIMKNTGLYEEAIILIQQPELASVPEKQFREKFGTDVMFVRKDIEGWHFRMTQAYLN